VVCEEPHSPILSRVERRNRSGPFT
jgi:hypothetical protein